MENYIYVELLKGGGIWLNTNHIMYLSSKTDTANSLESYFVIHLTNGEPLETNQKYVEMPQINFQDYIKSLSK